MVCFLFSPNVSEYKTSPPKKSKNAPRKFKQFASQTSWLQDYCPFGKAYFQGGELLVSGRVNIWGKQFLQSFLESVLKSPPHSISTKITSCCSYCFLFIASFFCSLRNSDLLEFGRSVCLGNLKNMCTLGLPGHFDDHPGGLMGSKKKSPPGFWVR